MNDKEFAEWVVQTHKVLSTVVSIVNFHSEVIRELCKDGKNKKKFDKISKKWTKK